MLDKLAVAKHSWETHHHMKWEGPTALIHTGRHKKLVHKETLRIQKSKLDIDGRLDGASKILDNNPEETWR